MTFRFATNLDKRQSEAANLIANYPRIGCVVLSLVSYDGLTSNLNDSFIYKRIVAFYTVL